ncbi:hypothetical protein EV644_10121 [Kribbella orskensis]|uniref:Uncharacterized protein n=1 Tax=Kribbella orskensis TaxID=2512216 RepID=A0ABY2BT01_9ACTN|nr:hypothetical protein EV642_101968 [Kribbella sp. VKM Ac-2500]TCO31381.1 hypothetical protein EV644_10121 [Kribbella orskensis]
MNATVRADQSASSAADVRKAKTRASDAGGEVVIDLREGASE